MTSHLHKQREFILLRFVLRIVKQFSKLSVEQFSKLFPPCFSISSFP